MKVFLLSFRFTPKSMKHLHTPPNSEEPLSYEELEGK